MNIVRRHVLVFWSSGGASSWECGTRTPQWETSWAPSSQESLSPRHGECPSSSLGSSSPPLGSCASSSWLKVSFCWSKKHTQSSVWVTDSFIWCVWGTAASLSCGRLLSYDPWYMFFSLGHDMILSEPSPCLKRADVGFGRLSCSDLKCSQQCMNVVMANPLNVGCLTDMYLHILKNTLF